MATPGISTNTVIIKVINADGEVITNANVTINGITLSYNVGDENYTNEKIEYKSGTKYPYAISAKGYKSKNGATTQKYTEVTLESASIETEITRIANAKTDIRTAINNKGGTVSDTALIDTYASAINNLSTEGGGNFAYAVVECDESFSSELETINGISVPILLNYNGLALIVASTNVSTNQSFSKIDTFEMVTFEDFKSFDFTNTYKLTVSEFTSAPDDNRLFVDKSVISTYKTDSAVGFILTSGTAFIPKANHFYLLQIKKTSEA